MSERLTLRPLTAAADFAAEVVNPDTHYLLSAEGLGELAALWQRHGVLVLRGLPIDDERQLALAVGLGTPAGGLFTSTNVDAQGRPLSDKHALALLRLNWLWHQDGCYWPRPLAGLILHGIDVDPRYGHTLFADLRAAYRALPHSLAVRLNRVSAWHSLEYLVTTQPLPPLDSHERASLPGARHPLVSRSHAHVPTLMLSPPYMESLSGWTDSPPQALVKALVRLATAPSRLYRHRWQKGDLLLCDNSCTMHRVAAYPVHRLPRSVRGVSLQSLHPRQRSAPSSEGR